MTHSGKLAEAVKRIRILHADTPSVSEQEELRVAREKMRNSSDEDTKRVCREMFEKYPDWCLSLVETDNEKRL